MFFLIAWQPLRNKFFKLKIFTDAHCVICWNHRLIQLVWILPRQLIIWLSSLYDLCVPGCTPNVWACSWWLCGWCPEGSPPRPGSGHQRAPGQFIAGLGFAQYMMLHRCAIGFRSGEQEGQSMASMPSSSGNCLRTCQMGSVWTCQWQTCQFWCSLSNASRSEHCWDVSTGPTRGRRAWATSCKTILFFGVVLLLPLHCSCCHFQLH